MYVRKGRGRNVRSVGTGQLRKDQWACRAVLVLDSLIWCALLECSAWSSWSFSDSHRESLLLYSLVLASLLSPTLPPSTIPPITLFFSRYLSLVKPEDGEEYRPEVFLSGRMHDFRFAVITQLPSPPKVLCDKMYTIRVVPQRESEF